MQIRDWLEGARLRTLPAAVAPVFVGMGGAAALGHLSWGKSALAFGVALFLQVGVNFANDYSDGIRGTDAHRVGPQRLTASGVVSRSTVLGLALSCFATAGVLGLWLVVWAQTWWMLAVGLLAVAAAWFYTGGKRPYGYAGVGLSELMVFIFFGLVATVGTAWVQSYSAPWWLWVAGSGIGLASVALLLVNNIRDIPTDSEVGKKTLCVRIGDKASRWLYAITMVVSVACAAIATSWWMALPMAACATPGLVQVMRGSKGKNLLGALRNTGLYALTYGILVGLGLALLPL